MQLHVANDVGKLHTNLTAKCPLSCKPKSITIYRNLITNKRKTGVLFPRHTIIVKHTTTNSIKATETRHAQI